MTDCRSFFSQSLSLQTEGLSQKEGVRVCTWLKKNVTTLENQDTNNMIYDGVMGF